MNELDIMESRPRLEQEQETAELARKSVDFAIPPYQLTVSIAEESSWPRMVHSARKNKKSENISLEEYMY